MRANHLTDIFNAQYNIIIYKHSVQQISRIYPSYITGILYPQNSNRLQLLAPLYPPFFLITNNLSVVIQIWGSMGRDIFLSIILMRL
jgi:hypothetical protein